MLRIKRLLPYIFLVAVSLTIGFVFVEILLRVLPSSVTKINAGINYVRDEQIAYRMTPHTKTHVVSACFDTLVTANSLGFRGSDWTQHGGIAVLGDSFMEAVQVNDDETLSALLAARLHVPVYNAGLSSLGTVAELLVYKTYVAAVKPKVVVLAMFENDIGDNHCETSRVNGQFVSKPCAEYTDALSATTTSLSIDTHFYGTQGNAAARAFIKKYCLSCGLLRNIIARRALPATNTSITKEAHDQEIAMINEAWQITEQALGELKNETEKNGAKLIVMVIPDQTAFYSEATSTDHFNSSKIATLTQKLEIPTLDLYPIMNTVRKEFDIQAPYFSYKCDGHWNATGHEVAANALIEFMSQQKILVQ
jgi:hypothetical protein